jgi:hypothetical protein
MIDRNIDQAPRHLGGTVYHPQEPHNPYTIEHTNTLTSRCWCNQTTVQIPHRWVRQGHTTRCGRPRCRPVT